MRPLAKLSCVNIVIFGVLYAPQSILNAISLNYEVSTSLASLFMTLSFLVLAASPFLVTPFIANLQPQKILNFCLLGLALTSLILAFVQSFSVVLAIRAVQMMFLPPAIAALLPLFVNTGTEAKKSVAIYTATGIAGGALSRIFSSTIIYFSSLQYVDLSMSLLLFLSFLLMVFSDIETDIASKPSPTFNLKLISSALGDKLLMKCYMALFLLFGSLMALLTYLPLRILEINQGASSILIGIMYAGYLAGVASAYWNNRIVGFLGTEKKSLNCCGAIFALSMLACWSSNFAILFLAIFLSCGAMIFMQSLLVSYINRFAHNSVAANSLFVAFYFSGASVGSFLPGMFYPESGWSIIIAICVVSICLGALFTMKIFNDERLRPGHTKDSLQETG